MSKLNTLSIEGRMESFLEVYRWLSTVSREAILSRSNLRLESVHPFADAMTIMDVSDPLQWRVRLAGTAVCERLGRDATGANALHGLDDDERSLYLTLSEKMFAEPCAIRAVLQETYEAGEQNLIDTLSLPLSTSEGARLVVTYAQIVEDINFDFRSRPRVVDSRIQSWHAISLEPSASGRGLARAIA
jgi:hypothetical protein